MFVKRLEILAHRLDVIAHSKRVGIPLERSFDLMHWLAADTPCGTVACAVGEACLLPEFQSLGLGLQSVNSERYSYPTFNGYAGFRAAAEFFGILREDADYLFERSAYTAGNDPLVVANRIRTFIKRGGRRPAGEEEFVPLCHVSGVDLCAV